MRYALHIILFALLTLVSAVGHAQTRQRIAGLVGNPEYDSLLRREAVLQHTNDSLSQEITHIRELFRDNPDNRAEYREKILEIESDIFDIRNKIGIVAGRIGAIEQQYVIENLAHEEEVPNDEHGDTIQHRHDNQYANLSKNQIFAEVLSAQDYKALVNAGEVEQKTQDAVKTFTDNYRAITTLRASYDKATKSEADSIFTQYLTLRDDNTEIEASVEQWWNTIFDNKTYAYNYMLEKLGGTQILDRFGALMTEAKDKEVATRGDTESETVSNYFIKKRLLLRYETRIAEMLGLSNARDSLTAATTALDKIAMPLPAIPFEERIFMDINDIEVHSPAKYNAHNPIPQTVVYPKGTIYRILLGSYTRPQPVSIFRGVYPIGFIRDNDDRYLYFAGGFETEQQAEKGVTLLQKRGFRTPKIAVWIDGEYTLSDKSGKAAQSSGELFGIEITGIDGDLPDEVKSVVNAASGGKDIARKGESFIVGTWDNPAAAESVATAIRGSAGTISVRVVNINIAEE